MVVRVWEKPFLERVLPIAYYFVSFPLINTPQVCYTFLLSLKILRPQLVMIYCVINFSDKTLSAFKIEATINCEFTVCSMFDFSDQTSYAFINRGAFE